MVKSGKPILQEEPKMDQVVILAGGHGSRMKAAIPKPMLEVLDVPMLGWVVQACEQADLRRIDPRSLD